MPWAEQQESEFLEESFTPYDADYLLKPVWRVKHTTKNLVAAVLYDGTYGMYRFVFLTGGIIPRSLKGLYTDKNVLIAKAKQFLKTRQKGEQFTDFALNREVSDEEVKETLSKRNIPIEQRTATGERRKIGVAKKPEPKPVGRPRKIKEENKDG